MEKGREEGRVEAESEAVLTVPAARGTEVPEEVRRRVADCADPATLLLWLRRAATVSSARDLFTG